MAKDKVVKDKATKDKVKKKGNAVVGAAKNSTSTVGGWQLAEFLVEKCPSLNSQNFDSATQLVRLFDEGNEVPFIARYRRSLIGDLPAEDIRLALNAYNNAKEIKARAAAILSKLENELKNASEKAEVRGRIEQARSIMDLDAIYEPFKPTKAGSLASRAKEVGLEPLTIDILQGRQVALEKAVVPSVLGVKNLSEVKKGVMHIASDYILKQRDTHIFIRQISEPKERMKVNIDVCSSLSRAAKKMEKNSSKLMQFKDYHEFRKSASTITNHQVLAIERGDDDKILSFKIQPSSHLFNEFQNFIYAKLNLRINAAHRQLFNEIIADCYKRLVEPAIQRCVWRFLIERAHESSIECFARNLCQLLLTPPLKNTPIIAIDPGFKHGCKVALISESSAVLHTGMFSLDFGQKKSVNTDHERFFKSVASKIPKTHKEVKIAIGNGKGCREVEALIALLIKQRVFNPFAVEYCIVSECGASVYSASELAQKELPDMDINIRSAVSIARRLQDPLAEYVKIEPKHLGVGMYQHSLNEKDLHKSLDTVVRECVSNVGVDVNTCSLELLQKVAGLNRKTAVNVIAYREQHKRIRNRQELREIGGIGPKSFEQCAGFVNIYERDGATVNDDDEPSAKRKRLNPDATHGHDSYCPLDATMVHPESYSLAKKLIAYVDCCLDEVGSEKLRERLMTSKDRLFADAQVRDERQLRVVFDALVQPLHFDVRKAFGGPVFRDGFKTIASLTPGDRLNGIINNVTDFGAFVDIGVGSNGLVHKSTLDRDDADNMTKLLQVNRRVEVAVADVDVGRQRIGLRLLAVEGRVVRQRRPL